MDGTQIALCFVGVALFIVFLPIALLLLAIYAGVMIVGLLI